MCIKNKIIAAALCALVAGIGIFGSQTNIANAQTTSSSTMSMDQMQQMINSLQQQIQQLTQALTALKSGSTLSTTTSSGTCAALGAACQSTRLLGFLSLFNKATTSTSCCSGLTCTSGKCVTTLPKTGCGNGICESNETPTSCAADCNCGTKKTCDNYGYVCGTPSNGCGGNLDCGTCAFGNTCVNGKCQTTVTGTNGKECFTINSCASGVISAAKARVTMYCQGTDSGIYPAWKDSTTSSTNGVATFCGTPINLATDPDVNADPNCDAHQTCTGSCQCPSGYSAAGKSPLGFTTQSTTVSCTLPCTTCCESKTGAAPISYNCTSSSANYTIMCYK